MHSLAVIQFFWAVSTGILMFKKYNFWVLGYLKLICVCVEGKWIVPKKHLSWLTRQYVGLLRPHVFIVFHTGYYSLLLESWYNAFFMSAVQLHSGLYLIMHQTVRLMGYIGLLTLVRSSVSSIVRYSPLGRMSDALLSVTTVRLLLVVFECCFCIFLKCYFVVMNDTHLLLLVHSRPEMTPALLLQQLLSTANRLS